MISIKKTDYSYRISLPKNEHVNIATVYNGLFFSIFPLEGLRVYKNNKLVQDDDSNNNMSDFTPPPNAELTRVPQVDYNSELLKGLFLAFFLS